MIYKHKTQRVAILVDVQNLYYSAKNLYDSRINFKELLIAATQGRQLVRANAYVIRTDIYQKEQEFFDYRSISRHHHYDMNTFRQLFHLG